MWISLALGAFSAPATAVDTPAGVVDQLFDAMRAGDGASILALVVKGANLDRLKRDGTIHRSKFENWAAWVDTLASGDADEQIFGVKTLQASDELATVWAPFVVSLKGEVKGCGVNQFTLAKSVEGWRVTYGIDMPTTEDCAAFRARIKAS